MYMRDNSSDLLGCFPFMIVGLILFIAYIFMSDIGDPYKVKQMVSVKRIENENKFVLKTEYLNNTIIDTASISTIDSIKLSRKIEGEAIIKKSEDLRKK